VKGLATGPSKIFSSSWEKRFKRGITKTLRGIIAVITTGKPAGSVQAQVSSLAAVD
jgi:hypothetical protein